MHGVAYDEVNDEMSMPVALGGAILVFRGGANGSEAPLRVIQGSKTRLIRPQTIAVDPIHDEIMVGDTTARAILIFDRKAQGDVAPKRVLYGDKTKLLDVVGVAVDPVRNVIIAASRSSSTTGIITFNRTDNGNARSADDHLRPKHRARALPSGGGRPGKRQDLPGAAEHAGEAARAVPRRQAATGGRVHQGTGVRRAAASARGSSASGTSMTTATSRPAR